MTTNSSESFNRVFTEVRSLPVSGIVEFSFHKCNKYFIKRWELAQRNIAEHIDEFPSLVHRWCMRHFAANFWRRQRKQEVCDKVKTLCCVCTEHQFKETKRELDKMVNAAGKA